MEFNYKKWLAIKYFVYAVFTGILVFISLPFIFVAPVVGILDLAGVWIIVLMLKQAFSVDSKRIVVNKEGIYICRGKKLDDYISWNAIDDCNTTEHRFSMRVGERFIHITTELNNFYEFEDLISGIVDIPIEHRLQNLPSIFHSFNKFPGKTIKVKRIIEEIGEFEKPEFNEFDEIEENEENDSRLSAQVGGEGEKFTGSAERFKPEEDDDEF